MRRPATTADLLNLSPEIAAEVVDGELVEKAAPTFAHGRAQLRLGTQVDSRFGGPPSGGTGGWWLGTEVDVEYETRETYRHDLVGWRRDRVPEEPRGRPVRIRPDWVCEILSESNASTDTVKKLRGLHRHGVPHYWIVNPMEHTLLGLRWTQDGFLTVLTAERGETVHAEPFEALDLSVGRIFGEE